MGTWLPRIRISHAGERAAAGPRITCISTAQHHAAASVEKQPHVRGPLQWEEEKSPGVLRLVVVEKAGTERLSLGWHTDSVSFSFEIIIDSREVVKIVQSGAVCPSPGFPQGQRLA